MEAFVRQRQLGLHQGTHALAATLPLSCSEKQSRNAITNPKACYLHTLHTSPPVVTPYKPGQCIGAAHDTRKQHESGVSCVPLHYVCMYVTLTSNGMARRIYPPPRKTAGLPCVLPCSKRLSYCAATLLLNMRSRRERRKEGTAQLRSVGCRQRSKGAERRSQLVGYAKPTTKSIDRVR